MADIVHDGTIQSDFGHHLFFTWEQNQEVFNWKHHVSLQWVERVTAIRLAETD